ncbi:hypothetical protein DsansV1_C21g0167011 [Dioscorea sansibarensis]
MKTKKEEDARVWLGRGPFAGDACEYGGEKEGKMTAVKGLIYCW